MSGLEIEKLKTKERWHVIIQPAVVYFVLLSVCATFDSVFALSISVRSMGMLLFIAVPLSYILVTVIKPNKKLWVLLPIILILAVIMRKFLVENVISVFVRGGTEIYDSFLQLYNPYYGTNFFVVVESVSKSDIMITVFAAQLILGIFLNLILRKKKGMLFAVLITLLPVICTAVVGYMPGSLPSWGLIISIGMFSIVYNCEADQVPGKSIVAGVAVFIGLFLLSQAVVPIVNNVKKDKIDEYISFREEIRDFGIDKLTVEIQSKIEGPKNYSEGGIGKGNFVGLSNFSTKGVTHMEVTLPEKPNEDIYLKAFVGSNYTDRGWEEIENSKLSDIFPLLSGNDKKRDLLNEPFYRIEDGENDLNKQHIEIENIAASTKYGYSPYFAEISDDKKVHKDATVLGRGKKKLSYDFYFRKQAERLTLPRLAGKSELWKNYIDFVEENYTLFPSDLEAVHNLAEQINHISVDDVKIGIDMYFKENLIYNKSPGEFPEGEDFTEYFLFDNQRGFCVHFATAATILYRECGYPSRYVEGYMVKASQFELQPDGTYKAIVTDRMAHAWCETFDAEKGWVVREHTLGYEEESNRVRYTCESENNYSQDTEEQRENINNQQTNTREEVATSEAATKESESANGARDESVTNNEDSHGVGTGKGNTSGVARSKNVIIYGSLFVILFVVLARVQFEIRWARKIKEFRIKRKNKGIANMYNAFYEICVFQGMKAKDKSDSYVKDTMKIEFKQLKEEEWEWLYDCAVRAAFSDEIIGKEEISRMRKMYLVFRKRVMKEMGIFKRLIFIYVRVL